MTAEWHALMFSAQLQQWLVRSLAAHASAAAWAAAAGEPAQASPQGGAAGRAREVVGERLREMLVQLCLVERHGPYVRAGQEVAEIGLHGFMAVRYSSLS